MGSREGEVLDFDIYDDVQADKLIKKIAWTEYQKYCNRVSTRRLDLEDFIQQGWVSFLSVRNSKISNLNYICVALRNGMYRQVKRSAIVIPPQKGSEDYKAEVEWFYIAGNETRLNEPNPVTGDDIQDNIPSIDTHFTITIENKLLVQVIYQQLNEYDKEELLRWMDKLPPKSRKRRENLLGRCRKILEGQRPYQEATDTPSSEIPRVFYDKSKDRWMYYIKENGKRKVLIRSKDKEEAENFALAYSG